MSRDTGDWSGLQSGGGSQQKAIDEQFTRDWVGHDSQSRFALSDRLARVRSNSMTRFYGEIIANLVRRAALLYEHGMARQGGTARLGRLLAPMGVRYIVIPTQLATGDWPLAPSPAATRPASSRSTSTGSIGRCSR